MGSLLTVGQSVPRGDGPEKVLGAAEYAVDVCRSGMLWGKALRSPLPHARVLSIDTSRAERLPGVRAVLTAKDIPRTLVGRKLKDHPVLAQERVRFVGEKVAAVAAVSLEVAEEALGLIDVDYEELPSVFDPLEALDPEAPILHPELQSYRGLAQPIYNPSNEFDILHRRKGDVLRGFAESDFLFEHTFTTQMMHQGYLEPHACLVEVDGAGRVQIWANNKSPYNLRKQLADATGLSLNRIVLYPCTIGGDYGGKGSFMDVPLCYHLARTSGRPVKMIMTYAEELMAGNPRHPSVVTVKTGVKKDGRMWARQTQMVFGAGAYGGFVPTTNLGGSRYSGGCYRIPHLHLISRMVYTNNVPCGHMRAPGEAQCLFAVESHTDMIAREMGVDPYEFRLQNAIRDGDVNSFSEGGNEPKGFRNVKARETLRSAAQAAGWERHRPKAVGRGMSLAHRAPGGGVSTAIVSIDREGYITLRTPIWDTGTAAQTILRQIVAEELTIPVDDVRLKELDTDALSNDSGVGAGRVTHLAGWATQKAARDLKQNLMTLAASLLECPPEEIVIQKSRCMLRGIPESAFPLSRLVAKATASSGQPLESRFEYRAGEPDITSFCVQVAEVEVDTETGQIRILKIVTAHDVATILHPVAHQGQIEGAFVQGLGFALMEHLDSEKGRISTLNLGEYKLPNILDLPELITVLVDKGPGSLPYDGKGIGEASLAPVSPAIANAIADAVGVRITDLPITAEKVYQKLKSNAALPHGQEPNRIG